jgi:hypothetical protein
VSSFPVVSFLYSSLFRLMSLVPTRMWNLQTGPRFKFHYCVHETDTVYLNLTTVISTSSIAVYTCTNEVGKYIRNATPVACKFFKYVLNFEFVEFNCVPI